MASPATAATRDRRGTGTGLVRLDRVSRSYDNGVLALDNFSLEVRAGEFVTLLGPSGCGKSTALRLLAGLGAPNSGRVEWSKAETAGNVGFVFQDPTLLPWATVFDNVFLPFRLKHVRRAAAAPEILRALDLVGLSGFADAYPRALSGGMRMRASIARAIVTRPQLLLMDEPFAALDEINRFKLNDDLLRLRDAFGWTVVFVTHSVFEAVYLSDRIVVMTPRPGRAFTEIVIDAPQPRSDAFRTSVAYAEQSRAVSTALQAAMKTGGMA